jgi:hypothetical protein
MDLTELEKNVHIQYGDLSGVVKFDFLHMGLENLCKKQGLDLTDKFVVGVGFEETSIQGIGREGHLSCSIFTLDEKVYGKGFDEVQATIRQNEGAADVQRHQVFIDHKDLSIVFKRVNLIALTHMASVIRQMNITDVNEEVSSEE